MVADNAADSAKENNESMDVLHSTRTVVKMHWINWVTLMKYLN